MNSRWSVLALLIALSIITYLDRICIAVAGPRMQVELGISPQGWGWVLGVFLLAYGVFEIPTGALGDRHGQRRILTRIVVWWSICTSLTGMVSHFYLLLLVRFLFGVGEAGAYPNMAGSVGRWFTATERARAQGAIWAASRVGGALTPYLVVPLMASVGWRTAFYLFGAVGLVWALVWCIGYRDRPHTEAGHADVAWGQLLRSRQLWLILLMAACYGWGAIFFQGWMPTYLVQGRGLTEDAMKTSAALPFVLGAIGNLTGGFLSDKLARRYGLRIGRRLVGSVGLALAALLFLTTALTTGPAAGVIALTLAFGVMDCMLPAAWALCLDVGGRHAGAVTAAMNTAVQAGAFACTVLFGYLVEWCDSYQVPLLVIAAMLLVSAILFTQLDPTRPLLAADPSLPEQPACA